MLFKKKKNLAQKVIEPDEIFLDSANLPGFERELFEGRIETPLPKKIPYLIFAAFLFTALFVLAQLFNLQVLDHEEYMARAENNTLTRIRLPAQRGLIYDRNMKEIAWNSSTGREYFKSPGLSHVLGYVGFQEEISADISPQAKIGRSGIEVAYDLFLRGRDGLRLAEEGAQGEVLSQSVELDPQNGASVVLTIDAEMQSALFSILERVSRDRGFKAGSGVILDVETGEILAAASVPEFSSEILSNNSDPQKISSYFKNESRPFFFRAFEGLYAPGSVFKPVVALAALDQNIIDPQRLIFSSGSISIPNPYFPDQFSVFYDWKAHGWVDMRRALAVSSNVYFYSVGGGFGDQLGLGVKKIIDYAKRIGLGKAVGVELSESDGFLPTPEWKEKNNSSDPLWRIGDTYNLSIGQGAIQVTPLQMARVVSAIASEGNLPDTHLVKGVLDGGNFEKFTAEPPEKINISQRAFEIVREGMKEAVLSGTASALSGLNLEMAGKTGTAELGSEKKKVNSWFIGFLPYDSPKMAVAIVLESGNAKNLVGAPFAAREFVLWLTAHRPGLLR